MTSRAVGVPYAELERSSDGAPYASQFADIYHSKDGGLAQARHVFLDGNDLPARWAGRETFTILETGFGLGLNFLAAWDRLRTGRGGPARLNFISVERHPLSAGDLAEALAPFEELRPLAQALVAAWPPPLTGFHRLHFDGGRIILTLLIGDAREWLPQLDARADALFLDGFAPARNPEMWSLEIVHELARLAVPGATLATWTVASGVRSALGGAGFRIERRDGFGRKREMLTGVRDGEHAASRRVTRRAAVIGAGLAGTLCAERLAARGWEVDLVDSRKQRASAMVGLVRPIANVRDAVNAQASRAAFLYALQHFRALHEDGFRLLRNSCGVLQLAEGERERERFAAIASSQAWPAEVLRFVDAPEAADIAGRAVHRPGWWIPMGACVSPESLALEGLARAGSRVRRRIGRAVARIDRQGDDWRAFDADGVLLAEAPVFVLANATDAARLAPGARLTLNAVRGQVSYLPTSPARTLDIAVCGSGYVAPLPGGGHVAGASYQHNDDVLDLRDEDHRENLARVESMLPGFATELQSVRLDGWAGLRTTVPDRMPVIGASELPGLWIATGLGSRGLLWAPLGAELIASALEDEPVPLPRHLAGAMSPARFLS